jgi:hypothetical protein
MDPHHVASWFLLVFGITMCSSGVVVLVWPIITKAHLVWPRERLFARYPDLRRIEHEDGCRARARDLNVTEFQDPEGRDVVRGSCKRCGAKHEQRYIPRGHPDWGVRCPGDD